MQLTGFTSEQLKNLQFFLMNYLFITKDFEQHYDKVLAFQKKYGVSLILPSDVLQYFEFLWYQKIYFSTITKNGHAYVSKKRADKEVVSSSQIISVTALSRSVYRYETLFSSLINADNDISLANNLGIRMSRESEETFMNENDIVFAMTDAIMTSSPSVEERSNPLLWNEEFLTYCQILLNREQWLLDVPDIFGYILSVLLENQGCYLFRKKPNEEFFEKNCQIQARILEYIKD